MFSFSSTVLVSIDKRLSTVGKHHQDPKCLFKKVIEEKGLYLFDQIILKGTPLNEIDLVPGSKVNN